MRKHAISLVIVALVVAAAVWLVVGTPSHPGPASATATPVAGASPTAPSPAAPPPAPAARPAAAKAPLDPAAPRTVAEGRAALARLTPAERAELAPLAQAFETAARAAAGGHAGPRAEAPDGGPFPVTPQGIRRAMRAAVPQLSGCYDPWLKLNPTAGGRVVTRFHIGAPEAEASEPGGRPAGARITGVKVVEGGLGNRFLDGCVLSVLSGLRFEAPKDPQGVTVSYPLIFSPSKAAAKAAHGKAP